MDKAPHVAMGMIPRGQEAAAAGVLDEEEEPVAGDPAAFPESEPEPDESEPGPDESEPEPDEFEREPDDPEEAGIELEFRESVR